MITVAYVIDCFFCWQKQDEEKEKEDKEKEKKRPGSRGSAKSKASQKDAQEMQETPRNTEPQEEERYWPVRRRGQHYLGDVWWGTLVQDRD